MTKRLCRLLILGLVIGLLPIGCSRRADEDEGVSVVEIREYQGERLGSVADFRENSIRGPQEIDEAAYRLTIDGLVAIPLSLSLEQLSGYARTQKLITLYCVDGWDVTALWEGIRMRDLLEQAQIDGAATTVIFHAEDGYTTSLPLSYVLEGDLIIADRINDIPLPMEQGWPFQLVAEDRWGYKWIRWLVRIELSEDEAYRGYWESRGYNNPGDRTIPMFEDVPQQGEPELTLPGVPGAT
ncbi:molybdopterin-dependent oxidoreductase [Candidatus Bipolaricaulota bacterium]|nr:molybdopterin-dependent oxidoreductase [Candidatus Bipolaricaulota bacterium]